MTHMVIFRSADGKPGYHQAETLEEAVAFVERLRNEEQVTEARVFRMDEVAIEFQVYYRVAVAGDAPIADGPELVDGEAAAAPDAEATEAGTEAGTEADDEAAAANGAGTPGRFGLFTRG